MLYATLKIVHLLGLTAWIGGMFFALACLRPAAGLLEPPARVRLMHAALGRFFAVVAVAAALVLASGVWLVGRAASGAAQAGVRFNMPLDWWVMAMLGAVMVLVFGHVRLVLYRRLAGAAAAQDWPQAAQSLERIRRWVGVNLALGVLIVVVTQLGGMS